MIIWLQLLNISKMNSLKMQCLPQDYTIPIDLDNNFNITTFMNLLSDKAAAFIIGLDSENYKVIFNTYNYMDIYDKMTDIDRFRHHMEQNRRRKIAANWNIILDQQPWFMIIYMYAEGGYRIGATFNSVNGKYEFGAYATSEFIDDHKKVSDS